MPHGIQALGFEASVSQGRTAASRWLTLSPVRAWTSPPRCSTSSVSPGWGHLLILSKYSSKAGFQPSPSPSHSTASTAPASPRGRFHTDLSQCCATVPNHRCPAPSLSCFPLSQFPSQWRRLIPLLLGKQAAPSVAGSCGPCRLLAPHLGLGSSRWPAVYLTGTFHLAGWGTCETWGWGLGGFWERLLLPALGSPCQGERGPLGRSSGFHGDGRQPLFLRR